MKKTSARKSPRKDSDLHKGASEEGSNKQASMRGQLSHRESNAAIKDNDSDFPEPGNNPEHSGQNPASATTTESTDDPGFAQKMNQNWRKEDPLAS